MSEVFRDSEYLAAYLGVPIATVRQWRAKGYGPRGVRIGRHVRYRETEIERWLTQQEQAELGRSPLGAA